MGPFSRGAADSCAALDCDGRHARLARTSKGTMAIKHKSQRRTELQELGRMDVSSQIANSMSGYCDMREQPFRHEQTATTTRPLHLPRSRSLNRATFQLR